MRSFLYIFLITSTNLGFSQELLRNPSFENNCYAINYSPFTNAACTEWDIFFSNPNPYLDYNSSYYFTTNGFFHDTCNAYNTTVPLSNYGNQMPRTGNAYTGIYTFNNDTESFIQNARNFANQKLSKILIDEARYDVLFYISLSNFYNVFNNSLQVLFSDTFPYVKRTPQGTLLNLESYHPQVNFQILGYQLNMVDSWQLLKGSFIANGTEEFMTIGNYKNNDHSDTNYWGGGKPFGYCGHSWNHSYYFIDDVSLTLGMDAGRDTVICANDTNTINLKASAGWQHYAWSTATGATVGNNRAISINAPGTYIVTGTVDSLPNYSKIDTVVVTAYNIVPALFAAHTPNDTTVCAQTPVTLKIVNPNNQLTYNWQINNSTAPSIIANDSGVYYVKIYSGTCYKTDSVTVSYYNNQQSLIDSNTIHITNLQNTITANSGFTNYEWRDENNEVIATTQSVSAPPLRGSAILKQNEFWVGLLAINSEGCLIKDTLQVIYTELPINYPTIVHKSKEKLVFKNLPGGATVSVYNSLGQGIPYTLQSGSLAEGVYYYVVRYEGFTVVRKLVVIE